MAGPPCMSDDGNTAVFVGTMLQTGDAVALCDECMIPWAAALLSVMTGVDPTPYLAAVSADGEVPMTENGAPTDEPPPPAPADEDPTPPTRPTGRTRKGRGSTAAVTGGDKEGE